MFKLLASLSLSAVILTGASAAFAKSPCQETAETNYAIAIAIDYPTADMVYENAMADCEPETETMSDADFRGMMLAKIATETDLDKRRWRLEALEQSMRCPNGYYDAAHDLDVCE